MMIMEEKRKGNKSEEGCVHQHAIGLEADGGWLGLRLQALSAMQRKVDILSMNFLVGVSMYREKATSYRYRLR